MIYVNSNIIKISFYQYQKLVGFEVGLGDWLKPSSRLMPKLIIHFSSISIN